MPPNLRFPRVIIALHCFILLLCIASAQQNPIAWIEHETLGQIADELTNAGTVLINRAGIEGSALLAQAGNQANVAGANIVYLFSDQLNKRYEEVEPKIQAIIEEAARFRQTPESVLARGQHLADSMTIDLMEIVRTVPLLSHVPDFYIQRIDGSTQFSKDRDLAIAITGIGSV